MVRCAGLVPLMRGIRVFALSYLGAGRVTAGLPGEVPRRLPQTINKDDDKVGWQSTRGQTADSPPSHFAMIQNGFENALHALVP